MHGFFGQWACDYRICFPKLKRDWENVARQSLPPNCLTKDFISLLLYSLTLLNNYLHGLNVQTLFRISPFPPSQFPCFLCRSILRILELQRSSLNKLCRLTNFSNDECT